MRYIKFLSILICIFVNLSLFAQNYYTISGYISDSNTGEMLVGANIYEVSSKKGSVSNGYGYYSISLPANKEIELRITYIGYTNYIAKFNIMGDLINNISLEPNLHIEEVVVTGKQKNIEQRIEMGIVEIPMRQIKTLPSIAGEKDIMKALQLMPGIKFGDEAKSGLYVRGGSPDQNLILLDDVPLYYVNHLGGYVSVFNTDAIKSMKMVKGNFPAKYGGRLSSVLDIRMKDGNLKEIKGNMTLGLLSTKFSLEGPIKTDTSSYLISMRRFMYDLLMKPLYRLIDGVSMGYTFYDINAKYNSRLSNKDRVYFSFYIGDDYLSAKIKEGEKKDFIMHNRNKWGNILGSFRWNHLFSSRMFGNLTYSYTKYRYMISFDQLQKLDKNIYTENVFNSRVNDHILKYDVEYFLKNDLIVKSGISSILHIFQPGISSVLQKENNTEVFDTTFNNYRYKSIENAAYLMCEKRFGQKFGMNIGVRYSNYLVESETYNSFEPRITLNHLVKNGFALKYSVAYMYQYVHLLSSSGIGMPSDLWVLSTKEIPPQNALQTSVGMAKTLNKNQMELSIEGYYKILNNLIDYREGASILSGARDWQQKVEKRGNGNAYGLEFLLQKKEGKTTGWIGFSLSRTTRQFENINLGRSYLYSYDRLLDIGIAVNHNISENLKFSGTWVFNTGNAFTLPVGYYVAIDDVDPEFDDQTGFDYETEVEIYEGKNTFRAKPYHRLDIGIEHIKQKKRGKRVLGFSIYNLYNHLNPFYYYSSTLYDSNGNPYKNVINQVSYFPIIPSISYSYIF